MLHEVKDLHWVYLIFVCSPPNLRHDRELRGSVCFENSFVLKAFLLTGHLGNGHGCHNIETMQSANRYTNHAGSECSLNVR